MSGWRTDELPSEQQQERLEKLETWAYQRPALDAYSAVEISDALYELVYDDRRVSIRTIKEIIAR